MLQRILKAFEAAPDGMSIDQLGRRLGVERSALEGMIDYLVRKGRLQDDKVASAATVCSTRDCPSCPAAHKCPFGMEVPRTFSLPDRDVGNC
ncbi:MAG: FeoC-like transcriptional regulator [Anaerolineales bacterium]